MYKRQLYVSGCPFHCVDCFNASIWDFQAGHEYTQKLEDKIIEDLKAPWVQGITFLGGEPFLNTPVLVPLDVYKRQAAYGVSRGCGCGGCGNDTLLQGDGDAIPRAYLRSIV